MRNLKRVLSLALALVMVLGMMVITTSAADYADKDDITEIESVEVLSALGIVSGDGTNFNPEGNFMRRDAAKLIAYMLGFGKTAEKLSAEGLFSDVAADHWAAGYIAFCADRGYIVGNGDGTFNPKGELTDIELGKLVLCALGYDAAKYTGSNWATAVTVDLLGAGLVEEVTGKVISREDACAMILTAMKAPTTASKGWYYVGMEETLGYYDTYTDAFNDAKTIVEASGGTFVPANVKKDAGDCLLKDVHQWNYNPTGKTDTYGRAAVSYDNGKDDAQKVELTYTTEVPDYTYTLTKSYTNDLTGLAALVEDVVKATEVEDMNATAAINAGKVIVNGTPVTGNDAVCTAMAYAAIPGTVMELYMANDGKTVAKIVVICDRYAVVTDAVEANEEEETDASFKVDGKTVTKVEGFKNDDVVIYTEDSTGVTKVTKLEGFAGTMTKYTKNKVFTIGDAEYKVSAVALTNNDAVIAAQGEEKFFYLDKNGDIVAMTTVPGGDEEEEEVVITDYAIVLGANATIETTSVTWPTASTTIEVAAQIQVLLDNGTTEIWDVPVLYAEEAVKVGGVEKVAEGKYYFTYGQNYYTVEIDGDSSNDTTEANTLKGQLAVAGVWTYADKALVAAVADSIADVKKDTTYVTTNSNPINATSYFVDGIILNDKTVFVLTAEGVGAGEAEGYVVKTGVAALESTPNITGAQVVVAYDAVLKADQSLDTDATTKVATLVFAKDVEFKSTDDEPDPTTDYVFVTGDYSVSKSNNKTYYTYDVVYADGTTGTIEEEAGLSYTILTAGIYNLMDDGSIKAGAVVDSYKTVKVVSGTTVLFSDDSVMTTNDKTVVIGGELVAKANAYIVGTGSISLAFVVEAE